MRISIAVILIALTWSTGRCSGSAGERNSTETTLEDEEHLPSLMDETTFKERYRRLIPYMTFYVANNYVNPQTQSSSSFQGRKLPTVQRRPQYSNTRTNNAANNVAAGITNKIRNQYYVSPPLHYDKFIPSVQYDPKDVDNEDFFTPVRYNAKNNFFDYQTPLYQRYQNSRPASTQATVLASLPTEQQYFTTHRPTTINFTPAYGDLLVRKQTLKPLPLKQDYNINHIRRPAIKPFKVDVVDEPNYSTNEFENLRHVSPKSQHQLPRPFRLPAEQSLQRPRYPDPNLNHIIKSLQLTNQLPEMLNADNIDNSIKTLVEILSLLNNGRKYKLPPRRPTVPVNVPPQYEDYENYDIVQTRPKDTALKITARPIVVPEQIQPQMTPLQDNGPYHVDIIDSKMQYPPIQVENIAEGDVKQSEKEQLIESAPLDDDYKIAQEFADDILEKDVLELPSTTEQPAQNYPAPDGVSSHTQNFPPTTMKYGATRGKPNVDYPAYATIPKTEFSCTTQRYKGFFGDPDTGCQVWHYCDLNGGKSSFLCPNGTIFSQVALTCDWWFNVKCESTTQLYVLNERLYKYILPVMPKFPEDFTGPEVDRYLELKFKEMEAKLKEKKIKKQQEEKNKTNNKSAPRVDSET
ncbi:uncharacterized protein LOC105688659 isoform X1 [Athalia rosae]|uniref:uncharacterized protein LOC105688659 isoform X1 n=1 Tax=Athalia rosae TaxID=37344 RepID=UPI00203393FB|nr:uncharacterized protein LOC105688659 isoform X1 [Athalia rosae]